MERTITVRGTGKLSVRPDQISVSLNIRKKDKVYETAMTESARLLENLRSAIEDAGFKREDLKTQSFNVGTEYESRREQNGTFRQVFVGYVCDHQLMIEFPFDTARLGKVLSAISVCVAEPELNVSFNIKDREALTDQLLKNAADNARMRAMTLAAAAGVELGDLISVNYNWKENNFTSPTFYGGSMKMLRANAAADCDMQIEAQDIDVSENAVFVWEII